MVFGEQQKVSQMMYQNRAQYKMKKFTFLCNIQLNKQPTFISIDITSTCADSKIEILKLKDFLFKKLFDLIHSNLVTLKYNDSKHKRYLNKRGKVPVKSNEGVNDTTKVEQE
jgi:hypothetical protein